MKKLFLIPIIIFFLSDLNAQVKSYESTPIGVRQSKRISIIESFLEPIAGHLNQINKKLDTMKNTELKELKDRIIKLEKAVEKLGQNNEESISSGKSKGLVELKSTVKTIKDDNIPILQAEIDFLKDGLKDINNLIKSLHPTSN